MANVETNAVPLKAMALLAGATMVIALTGAFAVSSYRNAHTDVPVAAPVTADVPVRPTHLTKAIFHDEVFGKTKNHIRAEFGTPDGVDDQADTWYYKNLSFYDETSGIQVIARIQFNGAPGDADSATQVDFS